MRFVDLSSKLLEDLVAKSEVSPRRRMHHNLHDSYDDPCQRLLNAIGTDSYIRPHRHAAASGVETLVCLRGQLGLIIFSDEGQIVETLIFGSGGNRTSSSVGAAVPPGTWHTVVALESGSILLEVKAGPFDPSAAKYPAPWAPAEGSAEAPAYLVSLASALA